MPKIKGLPKSRCQKSQPSPRSGGLEEMKYYN